MMRFAGNPLERASEFRGDPAWIAARRAEAQVLPLWGLKVLVAREPSAAVRLPAGQAEGLAGPNAISVFLGLDKGTPLFALDISGLAEDPVQGPLAGFGRFEDLRPAAALLPEGDAAILGEAKALIDWHQRHRFCPNCGAGTDLADGGWRRVCPRCAAEHFPRTDPVVIMLPVFADHCLIGHNKRFPPALYSCFAGFVEPGETIEEAVRRELREEVNMAVTAVRYHKSQPWPFPSALMIGCYAEAASRDFQIDGHEIEAARWISKDEARARLDGTIHDAIALPNPIAIARALISDWAEN